MNEQMIRVVQFQEGPWLVAQCLEVDIAAQAKTESDLLYQLGRLLVGRILASEKLGVDPFKTLPPAPKRYWEMYFEASSLPTKMLPFVPMKDGSAHSMPILEMKAVARRARHRITVPVSCLSPEGGGSIEPGGVNPGTRGPQHLPSPERAAAGR